MKGMKKKALVFLAAAGIAFCFLIFANSRFHSPFSSQLTPWTAVGGCGSSAGGGTGEAQLKWIGNGVSGTLFDAEIGLSEGVLADSSLVFGKDYDGRLRIKTTTAMLNLYFHPPRILDLKLSVPFLVKESNQKFGAAEYYNTSGFSDFSMDISRKWGLTGSATTALTLAFPTGNSSLTSDGIQPLSSDNLLGSGLFGASVRANYTFDHDWGIISVGGSYSAGLFTMKTTEWGVSEETVLDQNGDPITKYSVASKKSTFQFARSGIGARNDAGILYPDFLGVFTDIGIKSGGLTHGFSFNFSLPMSSGKSETRASVSTEKNLTLPTKEIAQAYADTTTSFDRGPNRDTSFLVMAQMPNGNWAVMKKASSTIPVPPAIMLQYSIEKTDAFLPILLGGILKLEYNNKLCFAGLTVGLGFKFPVY
jgi:hypothetical protein